MGNCAKTDQVGIRDSELDKDRLNNIRDTSIFNSTLELREQTFSDTLSFQSEQKPHTTHEISPEDFKILKVVGRGSFAKVYMVMKKNNGKIYAMKCIQKDLIIRTNQIENTKAERDIMKQINHPYIVKLLYAF